MGSCLPKTTLEPKLAVGWPRGASPNVWDPLLIYATVEARNFKFGTQLDGFGNYQETTFRTKIGGVGARGASPKFWDLLLISATIEASNVKFGTQLGFGE